MRGEGNVANVQVLPVSNVANFQLSEGCRGARAGRSGRFPEVRRVGVRGRGRPRFFVGCGRTWDGRRTLAALGEPIRQAKVLRPTSYVLKGDEDKGQRTKDKGWRTLDIGTENRKTIEKHLALWRFIAVNCINSDRPSFVL